MTVRPLLVLLAALAGPSACAVEPAPPRADETERIVRVVGDAISLPRQSSADGFARAALDTRAARAGELVVLAATDLHPSVRNADDRLKPIAHLVFRVHLEASSDGWHQQPEVTTCYASDFNRYGVVGSPHRLACPVGAPPMRPSAAPAEPAIPEGADQAVDATLRRAARPATEASVRSALLSALPGPTPGALPPVVEVAVRGDDIGVSVSGSVGHCLLGSRIDGDALVWRPSAVQVQPGELACDPGTALAREGLHPPH